MAEAEVEDEFTVNPDGTIDWTIYGVPEEAQAAAEAAAKAAGMTPAQWLAKAIYAWTGTGDEPNG